MQAGVWETSLLRQSSTHQITRYLWGARMGALYDNKRCLNWAFSTRSPVGRNRKECKLEQLLSWVNQAVQAKCEPDKGKRAEIGLFTPQGLAWVLALVLYWLVGFLGGEQGLEWRGRAQEGCCCLNSDPASNFPPPWQRWALLLMICLFFIGRETSRGFFLYQKKKQNKT